MMFNKFSILCLFLLSTIYSMALIDATIPNTMTPNTPALSADVNENWDSSEVAINRMIDTLNANFTQNTYFDSLDTNITTYYLDTIVSAQCSVTTLTTDSFNVSDIVADSINVSKIVSDSISISNIVADSINVDTATIITANITAASITGVDIDSGVIDKAVIGGGTAAAGTFTTGTIATADINGGAIDGTIIGAASTAAASFTTMDASGAITATTLNTDQGANELYPMDQAVLTTSDVTFDSVVTTNNVDITNSGDNPILFLSGTTADKVGILQLKGNPTDSVGGMGIITFTDTTNASFGQIRCVRDSVDDNGALSFFSHNGSAIAERMRLNNGGELSTIELSSGSTPNAGFGNWYFKTDGLPYAMDDAGTEYLLSTTSGTITPDSINVSTGVVVDGSFQTKEIATGATPVSGYGNWYFKTDGLPYAKNDAAVEFSLSVNDTGSFTGTLTGCTTSPTGTLTYTKIGELVMLDIPQILATSNTNACTITGLPVGLQPTATTSGYARLQDNSGTETGSINISGPTIHLVKSVVTGADIIQSLTGFTTSAGKGIFRTTITYRLD